MWIALTLLAGQAQAQEYTFSLAGEGVSRDTTGVCSTSVSPVVATATDSFVLPADALMDIGEFDIRVVATWGACTVRIDDIELRVDGELVWRDRASLAYGGSGRPGEITIPRTSPELTDLLHAPGDKSFSVVVRGRVGSVDEHIWVGFTGDVAAWRDRDEDGHIDDRLPDGTDCDDRDPERNPDALDFPGNGDEDCDGTIDNDTDSDGILDAYEILAGTNAGDPDSDGDGVGDEIEWGPELENPWNSDSDDLIDALDTDSDNDGRPDEEEVGPNVRRPRDSDGDGLPDMRDDDDDNDGLPTADEVEEDIDFDGLPGHLDPDSDGDGALDGAEGTGDADGDGVPNFLDPGGDGLFGTPSEPDDRGFGIGCTTAATAPSAPLGLGLLLVLGARRRRRRP